MGRGRHGPSGAVELHLHALELGNLLAERAALKRAPHFLRRNLSYVERGSLHPSYAPVLELQLFAAAPARPLMGAAASRNSTDVIVASLCVSTRNGDQQAFVPIAARAALVHNANAAPLSLQLPLCGPSHPSPVSSVGAAAGAEQPALPLTGLCVVLIHLRSNRAASLLRISSWERSRSGRRQQGCGLGGGGKPLSPDVTAESAFQLVATGSHVGYSIIPLDGLGGAYRCSGAGASPPAPQQWHRRRQQQQQEGPLQRLEGVLTAHLPVQKHGGTCTLADASPPFPWVQFQQQSLHVHNGRSPGGEGAAMHCRYTLRLPGAGERQPEQQVQGAPHAGSKRKARAALEDGSDSDVRSQTEQQGAQHGAQPPGPGAEQQDAGCGTTQPLLTFYFSSFDGSRTARACARGFACPHASCRGLRCHSYAGLQQHLHATHSYHSYYFSDLMPDGSLEVFLRCKPAWVDAQGSFLPRQLATAALEAHPLSTLLDRSHIHRHLCFRCPRRLRHLRLPGGGGAYPRDLEEEELEEEAAEEQLAAEREEEEEEAAAATAPSSSVPLSSSQPASTATSGSDSGLLHGTAAVSGRAGSTAEAGGGQATRQGKGRVAAAAGGDAAGALARPRGGRKPLPMHVRRQGAGLALLNHEGRPKFYHSHTCIAMTREELMSPGGGADSDAEGDLAEWQRDCRERLAERTELCPEERQFMFEWNVWVHRHPVHADADLPSAVAAFAAAHTASLVGDTPFRRCLTAHLLNLWRFRLLTPHQLHNLLAGMPRIARAGAAVAAGQAAGDEHAGEAAGGQQAQATAAAAAAAVGAAAATRSVMVQ